MKDLLRPYYLNINKIIYKGSGYYCNICNKSYRKFLPAGNDKRQNAKCPGCGSFERHRLLMYFLKEKTNFFNSNLNVLDVSPNKTMHNLFNQMNNIKYTSVDLMMSYVTQKVDLTQLPFDNETFDCIFCYHVLEHIQDDIKAISELYRVLKRNGWAIIQSPFDKSLNKTLQSEKIMTSEERKEVYGQEDHVRIYGKDFISRIESVGFDVKEDDYIHTFSKDDIIKFGLDKEEIINFCIKS
ncbi:MAG: class I SAM-dependent methyltransferase [Ignavibacteriae bacterium]|nr:class I SAM-dependent methyltransferase [Ignavibacteriota bacterium]